MSNTSEFLPQMLSYFSAVVGVGVVIVVFVCCVVECAVVAGNDSLGNYCFITTTSALMAKEFLHSKKAKNVQRFSAQQPFLLLLRSSGVDPIAAVFDPTV